MTKEQKRILSVTVKREYDPDPDLSYLEQEGFEDRKRQFDADLFDFIGIRAEATVQLTGDLSQRVSSGGLWGIESDSDVAYLNEIALEQIADLKAELHAMGFSKRAVAAATKDALSTLAA